MAHLYFPVNLSRQVECPNAEFNASTVFELLESYFQRYPKVRSYILDDQGHVRKHVSILVDGVNVKDRTELTDILTQTSQVYIFQALSGG